MASIRSWGWSGGVVGACKMLGELGDERITINKPGYPRLGELGDNSGKYSS